MLSVKIAIKYIFSKKSQALINIISSIAILGIIVGTAALVVLLSTFNGLKDWIILTNKNIDPSFKISLQKGKAFEFKPSQKQALQQLKEIKYCIPIYEDNALITYQDRQSIIVLKGVDSNYIQAIHFDTLLVAGEAYLEQDSLVFGLFGLGVVNHLQASLLDAFNPIIIYAPKQETQISINPQDAFLQEQIYMSGVLSVHEEFDEKTVLVPLHIAQNLYQASSNTYTSIELFLAPNTNEESIRETLKTIFGADFKIANQYEQHEFMYRIVMIEKIAVYVILSFILLIAMFNLLGIISILIIDKEHDIKVLNSLGMPHKSIKRIFFWQGFLMSGFGGLIGILLGVLICWGQQQFGWITINAYGDAYPVSISPVDLGLIVLTVSSIGCIAAFFGAYQAKIKRNYSA